MGPMGGGMLVDVGLADVRGWWAGRSTSADWRFEPDWLGPCGKSPPHTRLPTDQPGWWTVQLPQCQAGAEARLPGPRPSSGAEGKTPPEPERRSHPVARFPPVSEQRSNATRGHRRVPPNSRYGRPTNYTVQVKPDVGTAPSDVGGSNVQFTVSTSVSNEPFASWSWLSLIVAEVNAISSMVSVQFGLGQPGAPGMGVTGAFVVVVIVTFPFLILLAGTAVPPEVVVGAGFWPGEGFSPLFVHVETVFPVAVSS